MAGHCLPYRFSNKLINKTKLTMKKSLLFAAFLAGAMSASAQIEVCFADVDAAGLASDKATIAGGTVVGQSDNVTMKLAYEDSWGSTSIAFKGYTGAIVNGEEVPFVTGFTGSSNPGGQSLADGASTPATTGAVVQFDVKKDGYLTVFGKLSSNKEYYVWEGDAVFAMPVAYTLAMDWSAGAANGASVSSLIYTVPADDLGYIDFGAADIDKYVNGAKIYWPEQIVLGPESVIKQNGVGAIIFPVYAEAGTYLVHAAGSKISTCGAVFTTEPVTQLVLTGADEDTKEPLSLALIGEGGSTGISNITATEAVDTPAYNIAGQRVNADAKGLIIKGGKKYVNK